MTAVETIKKVVKDSIMLKHSMKKSLIAVYLFGSFAKGTGGKKSDIDLAFVFDEKFYKEDPFRALQETELLSAGVSKNICKAVDAVVLNGSSLSFAYRAVREGVCIYERDIADRILYEVVLENKYRDFIPFINELREKKRKTLVGRD